LIAADPGDGAALDRLAELAASEGRLDRAAELRSQKSALDPLKSRYKELFLRDQPVRDAAEMARLAERLGRLFEAKAFLSLAVATKPNRGDLRAALARLEHRGTAIGEPGQSLADVLAPVLDASVAPRPRPTPLPAQGR
jgi:enediyne biosynthesis protein E4